VRALTACAAASCCELLHDIVLPVLPAGDAARARACVGVL
jgi:hypothetical protein